MVVRVTVWFRDRVMIRVGVRMSCIFYLFLLVFLFLFFFVILSDLVACQAVEGILTHGHPGTPNPKRKLKGEGRGDRKTKATGARGTPNLKEKIMCFCFTPPYAERSAGE